MEHFYSIIVDTFIVKILKLYIIISCTHLYYFFPVSIHITFNAFIACYIIGDR